MKLRLKIQLEDNQMPGCPRPKYQQWNRDTNLHSHTNPPTQLATAFGYHISAPPQYPKLLISKFKHVIFHLFMHNAIKSLPSKDPLILYPFSSKHKTHFTSESICLPELRLEPIQQCPLSFFFPFCSLIQLLHQCQQVKHIILLLKVPILY